MDSNIYISIFGNPIRKEGAKALLNTQALPFSIGYEGYSGIGNNPYCFIVSANNRFTLYKLYCNNILTYDNYPGTLIFAVCIPTMHKLRGGKNVYDLLMGLREEFICKYMQSPTRYREITSLINVSEFDNILNQYKLEPDFQNTGIQMAGTDSAALQLDTNNTKYFFSNIRYYKELENYKEVIIAENIDLAYYPNRNLTGKFEIPRRRRYTLYCHDNVTITMNNSKIYSGGLIHEDDFSKTIKITSNLDPNCYNIGQMSFSINELLENPTKNRDIVIDSIKETITCKIWDTEKSESFAITINLPSDVKIQPLSLLQNIYFKIGDIEIPINNQRITLKGIQLGRKQDINVILKSSDGFSLRSKRFIGGEFIIDLAPIEKPRATTVNNPVHNTVSQAKPSLPQVLKIKVTVDNLKEYGSSPYSLRISYNQGKKGGRPELQYERVLNLQEIQGKQAKTKKMSADVTLPLEWKGKYVKWYIYNDDTRTESLSASLGEGTELKVDAIDHIKKISGISKHAKAIRKACIAALPIFIILTLSLVGYLMYLRPWKQQQLIEELRDKNFELENQLKEYQHPESPLVEKPSESRGGSNKVVVDNGPSYKDVIKFKEEVKDQLATVDLEFSTVDRLYAEYSKTYSAISNATFDLLQQYHDIVDILINKSPEEIKALSSDNIMLKAINSCHGIYVLGIYYGKYSWNKSSKQYIPGQTWSRVSPKANDTRWNNEGGLQHFLEHRHEYTRFSDLGVYSQDQNRLLNSL